MVGKAVKARPVKRRRKATDPLKEIRPRPNEGAFANFLRFAHRVGFHAWAQPDGQGVLLGEPNYDQDAIGELVNLRGGAVAPTPLSAPASPAITPASRRTSTSTARQ